MPIKVEFKNSSVKLVRSIIYDLDSNPNKKIINFRAVVR